MAPGPHVAAELPGTVPDAAAAKRFLRGQVRAGRRGRPEPKRREAALGLVATAAQCPELTRARTVAAYASLPGEPGTVPLLSWLVEHGAQVLLPVLQPDADLDWVLAAQQSGLLGREAVTRAAVVLAPALAVDTLGNRLGQGGGSYDRALARVGAGVLVVAVVHDDEVLDAAVEPVPTMPHDRPVQAVLTPSRFRLLVP